MEWVVGLIVGLAIGVVVGGSVGLVAWRRASERASRLGTELARTQASHDARLDEITRARDEDDTRFRGLAAEIVRQNSEEFRQQAREQFQGQTEVASQRLEALVGPVGTKLGELERHVQALETRRAEAYSGIDEMVRGAREQMQRLQDETGQLREALRSPNVRGAWGEQQLRNVVEAAGLRDRIDFLEQEAVSGGETSRRPDMVVRIPGGLKVVIDAKTPFDSYMAAQNAPPEQRDELLARHADSLFGHVRELGSRDYQRLVGESPDFVILFVAADGIFDAAQRARPNLWEDAWNSHNVLISTPGVLVAFLKTVALAWQREDMEQNALQITNAAKELYERLGIYVRHVRGVGKGLDSAVDAYNKSVGSFQSRLLPKAREMESLGVVEDGKRLEGLDGVERRSRRLDTPRLDAMVEEADDPTRDDTSRDGAG